MAYALQSDLVSRFGELELIQLTDRAGTNTIDSSVVAIALADADHEIDGYLLAQYDLPLSSVPPLLTRLACDLARFFLWKDAASDLVKFNAEQARDALAKLAKGSIKLPLSSGEVPAVNTGVSPVSRLTVFTDSALGMMP